MSAPESRHSINEVAESMTGYEEIGIERAFGAGAGELAGTMAPRALVFVLARRDGKSHDEAYEHAMSMPLRDVMGQFEEEADEVFPDEPETDQGKGD